MGTIALVLQLASVLAPEAVNIIEQVTKLIKSKHSGDVQGALTALGPTLNKVAPIMAASALQSQPLTLNLQVAGTYDITIRIGQ